MLSTRRLPDCWLGTKAPNVINHHPLIVQMLNEANALGVLELHEDRKWEA